MFASMCTSSSGSAAAANSVEKEALAQRGLTATTWLFQLRPSGRPAWTSRRPRLNGPRRPRVGSIVAKSASCRSATYRPIRGASLEKASSTCRRTKVERPRAAVREPQRPLRRSRRRHYSRKADVFLLGPVDKRLQSVRHRGKVVLPRVRLVQVPPRVPACNPGWYTSHRSGEFHRVDLVEHDERCPLRGQPAASSSDLHAHLPPAAAAAAAELEPRLPSAAAAAGLDAHLAGSPLVGQHLAAAAAALADRQRELDLAERFLSREQQHYGPAAHTREAADRDPGPGPGLRLGERRRLRRRELCPGRAERRRRPARQRHPALALDGLEPRHRAHRLGQLQPPPPPGVALLDGGRHAPGLAEPPPGLRGH